MIHYARLLRRLVLGIAVPLLLVIAGDAAAVSNATFMYATTTTNRLIAFKRASGILILDKAITGLAAGEVIGGIDFRPKTGDLYGLAKSASGIRLITIDVVTGAATIVSPSPMSIAGTVYGMSFSSFEDRIRVVSNTGSNVRINPTTGQIDNVDTQLAFVSGDPFYPGTPTVIHLAITNDTVAGFGTFVGLDASRGTFVQLGDPMGTPTSPNSGKLTSTAGFGGTVANSLGGMDIDPVDGSTFLVFRDFERTLPSLWSQVGGNSTRLFDIETGGAEIDGFAIGRVDPCNDLDGNGKVDPLTDGLLYIRALSGLSGTAVTDNAIGPGAIRATWAEIRTHMNVFCGMAWPP